MWSGNRPTSQLRPEVSHRGQARGPRCPSHGHPPPADHQEALPRARRERSHWVLATHRGFAPRARSHFGRRPWAIRETLSEGSTPQSPPCTKSPDSREAYEGSLVPRIPPGQACQGPGGAQPPFQRHPGCSCTSLARARHRQTPGPWQPAWHALHGVCHGPRWESRPPSFLAEFSGSCFLLLTCINLIFSA